MHENRSWRYVCPKDGQGPKGKPHGATREGEKFNIGAAEECSESTYVEIRGKNVALRYHSFKRLCDH